MIYTKVKDIMVPLEEYACVYQEATLYEAIRALEEAQQKFNRAQYKHRAVLVHDENNKIVGKLSQLDVLRGLEPKYSEIGDFKHISRFGFSERFIKSMITDYGLWQKPMERVRQEAHRIKVKSIMYTPTAGEYVTEDTSLDEAIHQLVIGRHQSLLVTKNEQVIGILRLTDVFSEVCHAMESEEA